MKTLVTALTLGTLIAAPAIVPSANRDSHDGYEGKKGGGIQWQYRACMTEHGQPE